MSEDLSDGEDNAGRREAAAPGVRGRAKRGRAPASSGRVSDLFRGRRPGRIEGGKQ